MKFIKKDRDGLFKSIFAAYLILLLHVLLLAGVAFVALFIKGVYEYLPWIIGFTGLLIVIISLFFYKKAQKNSQNLKEILSSPQFEGRKVEIKLLGGLASFTLSGGENNTADRLIGTNSRTNGRQNSLESSEQIMDRKLSEITNLYQDNLISQDEFDMAKQKLMDG